MVAETLELHKKILYKSQSPSRVLGETDLGYFGWQIKDKWEAENPKTALFNLWEAETQELHYLIYGKQKPKNCII